MKNKTNRILYATAIVLLSLSYPAMAQVSKTPEIAKQIKEIGNQLSWATIKSTIQLYQPLHQADSALDLISISDVSYGNHALQKLDIVKPKKAENLPVLIFTHGGGFVTGDKMGATNIARWAARNNMVAVAINYRLAPEAQWPEGAKDLATALDWVKNNIASYGGDSSRIILGGESAGAMHTSDYIFREELQVKNDGVIGAILISPPSVDETVKGDLDPERDLKYFGKDGDRFKQSVVNFVEGRKVPVLIAYSEFEPTYILDQTLRLVEAIAKRDAIDGVRKMPLVVSAPGHNHISISMHIGTQDQTLARHFLEFIHSLTK